MISLWNAEAYLASNVVEGLRPDCFGPQCEKVGNVQSHGCYHRHVTTRPGGVCSIPTVFLSQCRLALDSGGARIPALGKASSSAKFFACSVFKCPRFNAVSGNRPSGRG